jgi:hypothetical protein
LDVKLGTLLEMSLSSSLAESSSDSSMVARAILCCSASRVARSYASATMCAVCPGFVGRGDLISLGDRARPLAQSTERRLVCRLLLLRDEETEERLPGMSSVLSLRWVVGSTTYSRAGS